MLKILIPALEMYDEVNQEFFILPEKELQLEHSLVSISKWESKWHKSFINTTNKTVEETIYYIKCMTITPNVNPLVYKCLTAKNFKEINDYINDPMTATTFSEDNSKPKNSNKKITAEVIYARMIMSGIPLEWEKRHINQLITLIRVCESYQQPAKKMGRSEMLSKRKALNAARRKKYNSTG